MSEKPRKPDEESSSLPEPQIIGPEIRSNAVAPDIADISQVTSDSAEITLTPTVRTTDQGGLTYEEDMPITITNINETPTDIALSNSTIAENPAAGQVIGVLSTNDPDMGGSYAYFLVTNFSNAVQIVGNELRVLTPAVFNHDVNPTFTVRLRTIDQGGLTYEEDVLITVTDVSQASPVSNEP